MLLPSVLRTIVPVIVGVLLGQAARVGLDLPEGAVTEITTITVTTLYYGLTRAAEQRWPAVGRWLLSLGIDVGRPFYAPGDPTATLYRES
ncbi:hypothetical protein LO762_29835 [Actinocorallia sp. API 0066]|uniref:hypothetical protein n=1 Tax=Actinocorallia sp. API 0066 TaxID=2896846 RepID=UPI001E4B5FB9|nr:hypothetical protein [Actinocorallia sp. API 0066]MCD0453350.1 hypothetical protein [Actinocorallia sp. API 0066]